jgi:hypothetical protein
VACSVERHRKDSGERKLALKPLTLAQLARAVGERLSNVRTYKSRGTIQRTKRRRGPSRDRGTSRPVSKWDRWLLPAWFISSLAWTIWVLAVFGMQSREDMMAVLALISVPCALWYAILFLVGRRLDKGLDED